MVVLLLFTQQGLQLAFGLFGGLLVFRQLVAGGSQRLDGFDARLVEVVVVVEGAAQFGRILLIEQQFEVIVTAGGEGAFRLLGQQLLLMFGLLLQRILHPQGELYFHARQHPLV